MIQIDKELWQWDLNRFVTVDERCEVHFALIGSSEALVVDSTDGKAEIPNILLQDGRDILAWTVVNDRTEEQKYLSVAERARPSDYVYEETDVKRAEQLLQEVTELAEKVRESVSAMNQTESEVSENEKSRVESEYKRAEAESLRVAAETSRAKAETERQKAETERESAEESRKDEWDAQKFIVSTEWEECKDSIESQFDTLTTDFESNVSSIEDSWDEIKTDAQTTLNEVNAVVAQLPLPDGNVPKGMASGYVSHADDAYAAKPREVRIEGRTVKNLWPEFNTSEGGITFSTDETGLITVSGTATVNVFKTVAVNGIATSKQYALAVSSIPSGINRIYFQTSSSGEFSEVCAVTGSSGTTATGSTPASFDSASVVIYISSGTTVNASFRIMLVEGDTAPDCFVPTGLHSVKPKKLTVSGKNLLSDAILQQIAASQSGYIEYADGVITVNTNYGLAWDKVPTVITVPPGDYVVSSAGNNASVEVGDGTNFMVSSAGKNFGRFSLKVETSLAFKFISQDAATFPVTLTNIQLELGSTATAYEPPYTTEIPISLEEPLMSVGNYADELVIDADGTATVKRFFERGEITEEGMADRRLVASSDDNPGYLVCPLGITSFGSASVVESISNYSLLLLSTSSRYNYIGSWKNAPEGVECGVYRTWNSLIFWDKSFVSEEQAVESIINGGGSIWAFAPETEEPIGTLSLPELYSPVFNVYTDSNVPHNVEVSYLRDINIALSKLDDAISSIRSTLDTLAQTPQTLPLEGEAEPDEGTTTIETC